MPGKDNVSVQLVGFDEMERKLYDLPDKLAKRFMRKALRAGAAMFLRPIRDYMSSHGTGFLASQATMTTKTSAREQQGEANVGFRKKQNPARTGKGASVPTAANESRWYELGTIHQPARPFMRPAFEANWQKALTKFGDVLKEELEGIVG